MPTPISLLEGKHVDVLVIGAGINGASTAQHLRAAGYSVLLVDKGDYASGTTGRSTRLMHWGLQALAPRHSPVEYVLRPDQFVRNLVKARRVYEDYKKFRNTTPEYVTPIKVQMPIYKGFPVAGWQLDIGAGLIDGGASDPEAKYRRYRRAELSSLPVTPLLREPEKLRDLLEFEDCQYVWPERICIDAVLDTERMGGFVRNYTKVTAIERADDGWEITLRDAGTGDECWLTAKAIANMTGVWIDTINNVASRGGAVQPRRKVIATKGVHIMVHLPERYRSLAVMSTNSENEPIFCIPWRGLHYFGPTETVYHGDIEDVVPEDQDLDFVVAEANHLFPGLRLRRADIRFSWAGIRPITYDPAFPKGNRAATSKIFDMTEEGLPNVFTLTWGTINKHRPAAREMVATISRRLRPSQAPVELSYRARFAGMTFGATPSLLSRPDITIEMLKEIASQEGPRTLADLLIRRTDLAWGPFLTGTDVRRIAEAVSSEMGWNTPEPHIEEFARYLKHFHLYQLT